MGWSALLHLDDDAARQLATTPEGVAPLADHLRAVVGTDSYPGSLPPLRSGPWQRAGTVHSSARQHVELSPGTLRLVRDLPPPSALFVPSSSGAISSADLSRYARSGRFPVQPSTSSSVASAWHFHLDALGATAPARIEWGEVVKGVLALLDASSPRGVRAGSHVEALVKAGSLLSDGSVGLTWSGNLLSLPPGPGESR